MSEQNGLPHGWATTQLTNIADVVMGQSPPSAAYNEEGDGLPFFQGKAEFTDLLPVVRKWCSAPVKVAEAGDVLLSVRAPVGPTNLAPSRCCIGRGLAAIRALDGVESRYILYAIRAFQTNLSDHATGTTFEAITGDIVRFFELPVAPQAEQRRIVAAIEEQLSRLDAGVASLERARANLKRYRTAVLKAAVEGRLTEAWREENPDVESASELLERILEERRERWENDQLVAYEKKGKEPPKNWRSKYKEPAGPDTEDLPELPEGWCWVSVEQVISLLRNGLSQKPTETPPGHRILRISAVRPMRVDMTDVRFLDLQEEKVSGFVLEEDDLLFTRYNGSIDLLGVAGRVRAHPLPTLHPDKLIRVKTVPDGINPAYLELSSNVGASREHIRRKARTTAGQTGVSGVDIKQTPIPLPPLVEQEENVAEIQHRLSILQEVEAEVEANLKRATRLRQSILKRAFEGRLVPQDPADEPASELLERIRRERTRSASGKKAREKKPGRAVPEEPQVSLF